MFLPFGFFTSLYLKSEKITLPLLLTLIASLSIEIVQMIIGRVFDVDDIMLNLIGGALGYLVYSMFRNMSNHLPSFCRKEWFLNIVSVIIPVS